MHLLWDHIFSWRYSRRSYLFRAFRFLVQPMLKRHRLTRNRTTPGLKKRRSAEEQSGSSRSRRAPRALQPELSVYLLCIGPPPSRESAQLRANSLLFSTSNRRSRIGLAIRFIRWERSLSKAKVL